MSAFLGNSHALCEAARAGDFELVRALAAAGADLNASDEYGDSLLAEAVFGFCVEPPPPFRQDMLRLLVQLGADPNRVDAEGSGPLTDAMLAMDVELIALLLELGADPNTHKGFSDCESFYDWAEFDYRFNVYFEPDPLSGELGPPDDPTEDDRASADAWLHYLDRCAIKHGLRRPDHLFLLRKYGAKASEELVPPQ